MRMESKIRNIAQCGSLEGKYVLVRSSLNVPVSDGKVTNSFRVTQSLSTIQFLIEKKAKVILCSHIGREESETLKPIYDVLREYMNIAFSPEIIGETTTQMRNELKDGEVLLLENLRRDPREVGNDPQFAQELALLADIYVNDDFAASHRAHASLHAICSLLPSYIGLNFIQEYEELSKLMRPQSPSLFILGGAKFETKMPLVEKYLEIYDHVFVGGALVNDFFKAKGFEVGTSLISDVSLSGSSLVNHPKIILPVDVTVVTEKGSRITTPEDVHPDESIRDVGPKTLELLATYTSQAHTILWNGPLGNYENGYQVQTLACAKLIADSDAYSVVGGGDTVASIESLGLTSQYNFLSTAGGAMLTFLELGTMPALEALKNSNHNQTKA
jgi:phosphoglycerate kinase